MRSAYMIHAKEYYNGSAYTAKAENPVDMVHEPRDHSSHSLELKAQRTPLRVQLFTVPFGI